MRVPLLTLLVLAVLAPSVQAARIPTAEERAALEAMLAREVGNTCEGWYKRSRPLPLITDDRTWGVAATVCQHDKQPSGAGTAIWTVFAHRPSATSTDWTLVRPSAGNRMPPCIGEGGLFTTVPEPVVRELREGCANPSESQGYEPLGVRSLRIFRNRKHDYDDLGPDITLETLSEEPGSGYFIIDRYGRAAPLQALRAGFGTTRRRGCRHEWPRFGISARACRGDVSRLTLTGSAWRLEGDPEQDRDRYTRGQPVLIGDPVPLARYLDARLAKLPSAGQLRLPRMRIGKTLVTVTVLTRDDRIHAVEITFKAPAPR